MSDAWNVLYLAFSGVLAHFERVFSAFSLQDIILPLVIIGSVFSFLIAPIVGRVNVFWSNYERRSSSRDGERRKH